METRLQALVRLCQQYGIKALYAFGSRACQALRFLTGAEDTVPVEGGDLDVGVWPADPLSLEQKVGLTLQLEDLFGVPRVDLVCLNEADPFLAANVIRGERLYTLDKDDADEYELYILRRAGDLAPWERERLAAILGC